MADRTVSVSLIAKVQGFKAGITTAQASVRDFRGELDDMATKNKGRFNDLTNTVGGAGLVLAGAFAYAAKAAADFDRQMSAVNAVTNGSAQELDRLRVAALAAGKDTQYSATEAAKAEEELAKAGISTADILGGALSGALSLAAAGSLNLAEAADISAKTMSVFGLGGKDVGHIADVLASAANKSATDVHELGAALNQGGLAANAAGMGLEETTGTLAAFADRALVGSDAGTSLKSMLMMLQAPTEKSAKLMKELGINAYDANGQFIGTAKLAGNLETALGGMTQEQRNSALATIFGADAMRAANVLYGLGEKGVREYVSAVNDQGAAAETARKKTDNLAGDIERLKGSVETLAIEAGSGANGGLRKLVQAADALVGVFSSMPGPVQTTLTMLAGVGGVGLLAGAGLLKARATASDLMQSLRDMGPVGEKAATSIGRVGRVAGTLSLAGVGIMAVFEGFQAFGNWVEKRNAPVKANIDKLTTSIKEFAATGEVVGELASKYGEHLQHIGQDVAGITQGMADLARTQADVASGLSDTSVGENWNPVDPQSVQRVKDLDQALTALVTAGGASQAGIFLAELQSSGALTATQFAQLTGMLPNYTQAAGAAAQANTGVASGFGSIGANAQTMTSSLADAIAKGQSLLEVWKQLNGATLSFDESQLKARNAIDAVKKSFEDNGRAIEGNSRAALENRVKVGEAAQAAADAAQKKYEETGSVQAASDTYNTYISALKSTLHQAHLTDGQIDTLIATYGQIPPAVFTTVGANTEPATAAARALVARINNMKARINVSAEPSGGFGGSAHSGFGHSTGNRWGGVYQHAAEGVLREAEIASPMAPARYAWAERATGGEAFIPKFGDRERSLRILDTAAGWYGKSLANQHPMYTSGAGGTRITNVTYNIPVTVSPTANQAEVGRRVVEAIQQFERGSGAGWRA